MKKQNENQPAGENGRKVGEKNTQSPSARGKTPKQVVDEHIRNKHDVITDEEFKNLELNLDVTGDVTHEPLDIPENKDRPRDEAKDRGKITPWDVIE